MAMYYCPTIVQQPIPVADLTPLERLVLPQMFSMESNGETLQFYTDTSPDVMIPISVAALRAAIGASKGVDSVLADPLVQSIAKAPANVAEIEIDLSGISFEYIFQDIVRRSATLRYLTIVTSFTCSRMRPDGWGGMAMLITADAIVGKSTNDILEEFLAEFEAGATTAAAPPSVDGNGANSDQSVASARPVND